MLEVSGPVCTTRLSAGNGQSLQEGRGARLLRLWGSSFFIPSCRSRNACRSSGLQVQLFYLRFRDHCGLLACVYSSGCHSRWDHDMERRRVRLRGLGIWSLGAVADLSSFCSKFQMVIRQSSPSCGKKGGYNDVEPPVTPSGPDGWEENLHPCP